MKKAIIIFQKNAEFGKVKTRLAKDIGDEKALEVYNFLSSYTHNLAAKIEADKFVYFSDFIEQNLNYPSNYYACVQQGDDLGERMFHAFHDVFKLNYRYVIIIGTDCYELQEKHLHQAFKQLEISDFVLGPAVDGGYYLLGSTFLEGMIFAGKNWSTNSVLSDTVQDLENLGLSYSCLEYLSDIDTIDDLKELKSFFEVR